MYAQIGATLRETMTFLGYSTTEVAMTYQCTPGALPSLPIAWERAYGFVSCRGNWIPARRIAVRVFCTLTARCYAPGGCGLPGAASFRNRCRRLRQTAIDCRQVDWAFLIGARPLGFPGGLSLSREDFEAPALDLPSRRTPQFRLNDVPGPVRLLRVQNLEANGPRHHVGEL